MENYSNTSAIGDKEKDPDILAVRLRKERSRVMIMFSLLVFFTLFYACLKNPFIYTFSKIGNYYSYRWLYIAWALVASTCLHSVSVLLFRLTNYPRKWAYWALVSASFFLIATAIIPSIREQFYFLHVLHKWTTFFFVMSLLTALHPFFIWLARKNPQLATPLRNWQLIILTGSMLSLLLQGQTGIFELWFFLGLGTLLMYLAGVLYKQKMEGLKYDENLNKNERP